MGRRAGAPNTDAKATVWDRPSKMIEATPTAHSATRAIDHGPRRSPVANGRRSRTVASTASGSASSPSSAVRAAGTTPNGASRFSVRNQTVNVSPWARHSSRPNWAISATVSSVYPTSTTASVDALITGTSSSQTKNARPMTAGQARALAGRTLRRQPRTPSVRRTHAKRSWIVANGSSHSQTGNSSAEQNAIPTQPKTHRNSGATAASDEPPVSAWATIHTQPMRPMARRTSRRAAGTRTSRPSTISGARTSRARMNRNERATVTAAPTR